MFHLLTVCFYFPRRASFNILCEIILTASYGVQTGSRNTLATSTWSYPKTRGRWDTLLLLPLHSLLEESTSFAHCYGYKASPVMFTFPEDQRCYRDVATSIFPFKGLTHFHPSAVWKMKKNSITRYHKKNCDTRFSLDLHKQCAIIILSTKILGNTYSEWWSWY